MVECSNCGESFRVKNNYVTDNVNDSDWIDTVCPVCGSVYTISLLRAEQAIRQGRRVRLP